MTCRRLVIVTQYEGTVGCIFNVDHTYGGAQECLDAIRAFLKEWAHTDEGKEALVDTFEDYNWGDFISWGTDLREKIPGILDIQTGYPVQWGNMLEAVLVDQDELLLSGESSAAEQVYTDEPLAVLQDAHTLIKGDVRVRWENIGEGWSGDYNPDDPEDNPLFRFTVAQQDPGDPQTWADVDDASYCTQVVDDEYTTPELLEAGLRYIMSFVYDPLQSGARIKRICEQLSWLSRNDLRKIKGQGTTAPVNQLDPTVRDILVRMLEIACDSKEAEGTIILQDTPEIRAFVQKMIDASCSPGEKMRIYPDGIYCEKYEVLGYLAGLFAPLPLAEPIAGVSGVTV